jgi:hypothetical protein
MMGTKEDPGLVPRVCSRMFEDLDRGRRNYDALGLAAAGGAAAGGSGAGADADDADVDEEAAEGDEEGAGRPAAEASGRCGDYRDDLLFIESSVEASYLEIYNEQIRDLFHGTAGAEGLRPGTPADAAGCGSEFAASAVEQTPDGASGANHPPALEKRGGRDRSRSASSLLDSPGLPHRSSFGDDHEGSAAQAQPHPPRPHTLRLREHRDTGAHVENLTTVRVTAYAQVAMLLAQGNRERTTASTALNATSSRSHAIFTLRVIATVPENVGWCWVFACVVVVCTWRVLMLC